MFFIMIFGPEPEQNNTPRFTKTTIFPIMNPLFPNCKMVMFDILNPAKWSDVRGRAV